MLENLPVKQSIVIPIVPGKNLTLLLKTIRSIILFVLQDHTTSRNLSVVLPRHGTLKTLNGVPHGLLQVLRGILIGPHLGAQVIHGRQEEVHRQLPQGLTPMRYHLGRLLQLNGQHQHLQPVTTGATGQLTILTLTKLLNHGLSHPLRYFPSCTSSASSF